MQDAIIETQGLTRNFKKTCAVDTLDLAIGKGELFGLVGPDGAGKTTTLRLLAGLLDLHAGEATVAGFNLRKEHESIKKEIGYMAQQFSLYAELTVLENLRFFAEIYDVPANEMAERTENLLQFARLTEFKERRAAHLSGGMQKKLALACTLIHEPKLLLLDEPTTGVDPISRREFWDILTNLHLNGTTIIVSTPYMDEADRCSRVGLIYEGKLIICDSPRQIKNELPGEMVEFLTDEWQKAKTIVEKLPGVLEAQTYGEALHLLVDDGDKRLKQITETLAKKGIRFRGARVAPVRMEEAFISLIQRLEDKDASL